MEGLGNSFFLFLSFVGKLDEGARHWLQHQSLFLLLIFHHFLPLYAVFMNFSSKLCQPVLFRYCISQDTRDTRDGDEILTSLNYPWDRCYPCGAVAKFSTGHREARV